MVMDAKYRKQKWQVYFWRPEFLGLPEPETLEEVEQQFRYIPSLAVRPDPLFRGLAAEMHNELVRQSSSCPSLLKDYGNLIEQERERRESIFHFPLLGEGDDVNFQFDEAFIHYSSGNGLIAYMPEVKIAFMPDGRLLKPNMGGVGGGPLPAKKEAFQNMFADRVLELLAPLGYSKKVNESTGEKVLVLAVDGGLNVVKPLISKLRNGAYEANIDIDITYKDVQEITNNFGLCGDWVTCNINLELLMQKERHYKMATRSEFEAMLFDAKVMVPDFLEKVSTRKGLALLMTGDEFPVFRDRIQKYYIGSCLVVSSLAGLQNFDEIVEVLRQKGAVRWTTPPSKDLRENFERLVAHLREGVTS